VEDRCKKIEFRSLEWIVLGELDVESENSSMVRGVYGTTDEYNPTRMNIEYLFFT